MDTLAGLRAGELSCDVLGLSKDLVSWTERGGCVIAKKVTA
jgi:hypothetical protein